MRSVRRSARGSPDRGQRALVEHEGPDGAAWRRGRWPRRRLRRCRRGRSTGPPSPVRRVVRARPGGAARRRASVRRRRASATPRLSSSATIAASTADASGLPAPSSARSSRQPAAGDGGVELGDAPSSPSSPTVSAAEVVHDLGDGVAQRVLLGGQADVHQGSSGWVRSVGASSSRRVRRSTLPDGRRGMASTTTRWRRCL